MSNILLISENKDLYLKYKDIIEGDKHKFTSCGNATSVFDIIEIENFDVVLLDENADFLNLNIAIKKIKSKLNNVQVILIVNSGIDDTISSLINGYILTSFSDLLIKQAISSATRIKEKLDSLAIKNEDLSNSLYRINVLYNTSSQFAGSLDVKELLNYMVEGLDKSLSFALTSTISFGFENEPVLIINSLYDISEELMAALKLRAILNYKALFKKQELPFELEEKNLKIVKRIKNLNSKFTFNIFQYDSMFAPIDLGDKFFGCIEIFKEKPFTSDDSNYFQTIVKQVSLPLKSAGLYKEIMSKNEELYKLERVKSEFISIVSHELRTPLTPIKNALSILASGRCGEMSEDATKFIKMAQRNANNLTNIINDILDINKIEAGKMDFSFKQINIHSVIENIKNSFECVAKEQEIDFSTVEQENIPEIYADSQRLGQVLTNLVSNAFKFTSSGKKVTIQTELKNANEIISNKYFEEDIKTLQGDYVIVSVIDEGIGIKEEDLLKTFEKFTQIENPLSRNVGGTGLGLAIAKQLIKAHKGTIWCDSKENEGSCFNFAIPVVTSNIENKTIQKELV